MKTKINFNVDSTEITKQINAVVTADAISKARKIAQQQFDTALESKIATIIKAIDDEVKPAYWHNSALRQTIIETIKTATADIYKSDADGLRRFVATYCAEQMKIIKNAYFDDIRTVRAKIENQVKQEVETYMKNAAIQAIFGNIKSGV